MALFLSLSAIHGIGLFSDKHLDLNEDVTTVFDRIQNTGIFVQDFKENKYGRYTNHSVNPSTEIILRENDIILRANKIIPVGQEITADYYSFIKMFNNDPTLIKLIRFW